MEVSFTRRFNACEAFTAYSTACRFRTGSAPGIPRQTGHTFVLGPEPKTLGQPQKILLRVSSCTCTSRPITVSYFDSTPVSLFAAIAMVPPIIRLPPPQARRESGSCEGAVPTQPGSWRSSGASTVPICLHAATPLYNRLMSCLRSLAYLLLLAPFVLCAQRRSEVTPAEIAAHVRGTMSFLASDALRGRGSGTHDELVAAVYVVSQFQSFGLDQAELQRVPLP